MNPDSFPSTAHVSAGEAAEFNRWVIDEFRANNGKLGGPFAGTDLILLSTVGARSDEERTIPVAFVRDGERLLVVASAAGADHHPAWYHNLLAHPMVEVETGAENYGAIAVPTEAEERDQLFHHIVQQQPGFADYQASTDRPLPVVKLERSYTEANRATVNTVADKLVEIHTWLRGQLSHIRTEVEEYFADYADHQGTGEQAPPGIGLQIRQHCLAFCEALHGHHAGEDAHMLPDLERLHPELRDVLQRLRTEHRTVERIQRELQQLLADITTADPHRFRSELDRMATELTAHLSYEEESLLPVLADIPLPPETTRRP